MHRGLFAGEGSPVSDVDLDASLEELKRIMRLPSWGGGVRMTIVSAWATRTGETLEGVLLEYKEVDNKGRWKKFPTAIYPPEGGTLADVFTMLASFREGV